MSSELNERFVRWQERMLDQSGGVNRLLIALSTGLLAFQSGLVFGHQQIFVGIEKMVFLVATVLTLVALALGIAYAWVSIDSFARTKDIVRIRKKIRLAGDSDKAALQEKLKSLRHNLEPVDQRVKWLFRSQSIAFGLAALATVLFVAPRMLYSNRFDSADGAGAAHEGGLGPTSATSLNRLDCGVLIVGGGAGGLHTAFRLGQQAKYSVCLFEREQRLGGRIFDVSFDGAEDSPRFGVGARRIEPEQSVLLALAKVLGISYEIAPYRDDFILSRGRRVFSKDKLARLAYPLLAHFAKDPQRDSEVEDALYEQLRKRRNLQKFPDFPSYVRATVGVEGYHYLLDVSRFRGDFEYPLDARGYLDWLDQEFGLDTRRAAYPVGGMSEFVRKMARAAEASGVRIFTGQPVTKLSRTASGYEAFTRDYRVTARRVVIAVDADALKNIGGDMVQAIVSTPQYRQLIGVKVVTVTQWWPEAWWPKAYLGKDIRRVWTTDYCVNFIEMPVDSYGTHQLVTRTVYSDEMSCVALWEQLRATSLQAVESEITRELHEIFPRAEIPKPLKTYVQVWPGGWYWLRAGSPFTNADIAKWAIEPIHGEAVSLVGESYNPQRSTWSDAAYKSSIATLNARFGFNLPGAATTTQ